MRKVRVAVLIGFTVLFAGLSAPSFAQDGPDYVGSSPPPAGSTVTGSGDTEVAGISFERGGPLPITGADIALLFAGGVGLLATGLVIRRAVRTRLRTSS